jgi:GntR family transcriptional regulator
VSGGPAPLPAWGQLTPRIPGVTEPMAIGRGRVRLTGTLDRCDGLTMEIDKQDGQGDGQASVSPLVFRLDPRSGVPTYLQLVHQVEHALRLGYLRRGDQLPRVKDVVASLAINPNTVLKAYRDLEYKGLAGGRPGQGTFIEVAPDILNLEELVALRKSLVSGWLAEAAAAGLDDEGITALFMSALQDFRDRSGARARPRDSRGERPGRQEVVA